jgi:hypothetical protein
MSLWFKMHRKPDWGQPRTVPRDSGLVFATGLATTATAATIWVLAGADFFAAI